jgi:hypothetical protein
MQPQPAASAAASRPALALGAASLFFLSFLMSGASNVLPQLFYQKFYPERKAMLLAVTLFLSTACSLAGVAASRRRQIGRRGVLLGLAITIAAALALLSIRAAILYMALVSLVQFADNYLLNRIDHAAVARSGVRNRQSNDVMGNVARLVGMLAAPAFFPAFYGRQALVMAPVLVAGSVACAGVAVLFRTAALESGQPGAGISQPPERPDRLLFAYAVSVYVALYLFAANMIYLLRDLLQMPHAELRGGQAIVAVFVAAASVNGTAGALRRASGNARAVRVSVLSAQALALILSGGLLAAGVRPSFPVFLLFSVLVGGGYGAFLLELREYASRGARERNQTALLSWFNNMANVSALMAFGLMVVLAVARAHAPGTLYLWTLSLIAGVPVAGLIPLFAARRALHGPAGWRR